MELALGRLLGSMRVLATGHGRARMQVTAKLSRDTGMRVPVD